MLALHRRDYCPEHKIPDSPSPKPEALSALRARYFDWARDDADNIRASGSHPIPAQPGRRHDRTHDHHNTEKKSLISGRRPDITLPSPAMPVPVSISVIATNSPTRPPLAVSP